MKDGEAPEGSWSWIKEWTGYVVTVLPYVSSGIVLVQSISIYIRGAILLFFAIVVVSVRVLHEKAGVEVTGPKQKQKKPR